MNQDTGNRTQHGSPATPRGGRGTVCLCTDSWELNSEVLR